MTLEDIAAGRGGLTRWRSRAAVWAGRITRIERVPFESGLLLWAEGRRSEEPIELDGKFAGRNSPRLGGYLVVYSDSYAEYQPTGIFDGNHDVIVEPRIGEANVW